MIYSLISNGWLAVNAWLKEKNSHSNRKFSQHNPDIYSPLQCCAGPWRTCALSQWSPWQHGPHRSAWGWAPWCPWRQERQGFGVFCHLPSYLRRRCCCSTGCWSPWAPDVPASGLWSQKGGDCGPLLALQPGSVPSLCPPRSGRAGCRRKEGQRCSQKGCDYHGMSQRTGWTLGSLDVHPLRPAAPHIAGCNSLVPGQRLHGHFQWRGARTAEEILVQVGGTQTEERCQEKQCI